MPAAAEKSGRRRRIAGSSLALLPFITFGTVLATGVLVQGTSGDDYLDFSVEATSYEVFGNGGWDTIRGSTAADIIYGGAGNDQLYGGAGSDRVYGGTGNDSISGDAGDDLFLVTSNLDGFDSIDGGAGQDRLTGTDGDDLIGVTSMISVEIVDGGPGQDTLQLNSGGRTLNLSGVVVVNLERISGGTGRDAITGSSGNDRISGGPGNDTIDGAAGNDTVFYARNFGDYSLTVTPEGVTVRDLVGNDGSDSLSRIEVIEFADGRYADGAFEANGGSNSAPTPVDDTATVTEDGTVDIAVLANDVDPDGDAMSTTVVIMPGHGTATVNPNGAVLYVPARDYSGMDSFVYEARDSRGAAGRATVDIQVLPTPDAPKATDDSATTGIGRSVTINVLANDFDADGEDIVVLAVGAPMHGEAVRESDQTISYTPTDAYAGADEFSYTISDGTGRTANATVRLTVESVDISDPLMAQLAAAPEGSWVRLNRNRFSDVWVPAEQRPNTPGYTNPAKVVFAWGSMAWDPNRAQLIFWGGGHANYSGNEVYRFDARSGLWARASLPSDVTNPLGDSQFFAVDGPRRAPTSSHTYDNQEFLPLSDRFVTFGGAKFNGKQKFVLEDGVTLTGPYFWDPSRAGQDSVGGTQGSQVLPERYADVDGRQMWANRDTVRNQGVAAVRPSGDFVNSTSAYEEFEGRDSILVTESPRAGGRLFRYVVHDVDDATRDEWILVGGKGISYGNQGAGAVDSGRRLYARTASTSSGWGLVVWNTATLGSRNYPYEVHPTDQRGLPLISALHGMDFDPVRNVFVVWDGGPDVWHLKPGSSPGPAGWTAAPALSRPDLPTPLQSDASLRGHTGSLTPQRGVLGKWKYSRRYDVMLGMVSPEAGDVWAFKPTGWRPPSN